MSRQDANAAFALSSFLYGGNAAYIEDLYAKYEADPKSVEAEWQAFIARHPQPVLWLRERIRDEVVRVPQQDTKVGVSVSGLRAAPTV